METYRTGSEIIVPKSPLFPPEINGLVSLFSNPMGGPRSGGTKRV